MKIRTLLSATVLASSIAVLPQAHAFNLDNALSTQSRLDSVTKSVQGEESKLSALKEKYTNAPAEQKAKIQKRIDSLQSNLKKRQEKLEALQNKYKNLSSEQKEKLQNKLNEKKQKIEALRDKYKNAPAEQKEKIQNQVNEQKQKIQNLGSDASQAGQNAVQSGKDMLKGF